MNLIHFSRLERKALAYPYLGRSTRNQSSLTIKWLINLVFPGSEEVLARSFFPISILMREDFPTLDLPIKANSGRSLSGHNPGSVLLMTNSALLINIDFEQFCFGSVNRL